MSAFLARSPKGAVVKSPTVSGYYAVPTALEVERELLKGRISRLEGELQEVVQQIRDIQKETNALREAELNFMAELAKLPGESKTHLELPEDYDLNLLLSDWD